MVPQAGFGISECRLTIHCNSITQWCHKMRIYDLDDSGSTVVRYRHYEKYANVTRGEAVRFCNMLASFLTTVLAGVAANDLVWRTVWTVGEFHTRGF